MQDIISGTVSEDPDSDNLILELEVAPNTVFLDESPGLEVGSITTQTFISGLANSLNEIKPNTILNIRQEDGTLVSVPIEINNSEIDTNTGIVQYEISALEITTEVNPGPSVDVKSIDFSIQFVL